MAAHFDFAGLSIERFYHFVCKADAPTFALMQELGIADKMRWRATSMAYFVDGALHRWGDPISLLRFPHLSPDRQVSLRPADVPVDAAQQPGRSRKRSAKEWIESWCGAQRLRPAVEAAARSQILRICRQCLGRLDLDAHQARRHVAQIDVPGRARLYRGRLGDAGSMRWSAIAARGGRIQLATPAQRVATEERPRDGRAGRRASSLPCDAVISTVPTPYVSAARSRPAGGRRATPMTRIRNIGVVCVVLKLKRSVTPHFWVNVVDRTMAIPGMIEFSNLRPTAGRDSSTCPITCRPQSDLARPDEASSAEAMAGAARINPAVDA